MAQRDASGGWRTISYRADARAGAPHRRRAARARSFARAADRDPVRQRPRARAARARRHVCRHPLCADLAGLFAGLERLRQAAHHRRPAHAGPGVRRRRRGRSRAPSRRWCRRTSSCVVTRNPLAEPPDDAVRRSARRRADRRGRRGACAGRARHHRQIPVHLRLDRHAEGRDQHPAHVVLEPGDDAHGARLSSRTSRR